MVCSPNCAPTRGCVVPADEEVEVEFDFTEVTGDIAEHGEEPIDWESLDFEEPEPPIAPYVQGETTWSEIDARAVLAGALDEDPPAFVERTDGVPLLYRGKVSSIAGEPESGKSWFALHAVADVLAQGHHAIYLDFEDGARGVFAR